MREIQKLEQEIFNLKKENENLKYQLILIKNSRSWKITAPLRFLGWIAREFRGGRIFYKLYVSIKTIGFLRTVKKIKNRVLPKSTTVVNLGLGVDISFSNLLKYFEINGCEVRNTNLLKNFSKQSSVLLVSHQASLTGAPIALRFMSLELQKMGYSIIYLTNEPGPLLDELEKDGVCTVVYPIYSNQSGDFILRIRNLFSFIVCNTAVGYSVVSSLIQTDTPVIWWIHEAEAFYKNVAKYLPHHLTKNILPYAGGVYAQNCYQKYMNYQAPILNYPVPDSLCSIDHKTKSTFTFACIGSVGKRKGQDLLISALFKLPSDVLEKSNFVFIGNPEPDSENIFSEFQRFERLHPGKLKYIERLSPADLEKVYLQMDCLLAPSRDDPMPIVVTEAFKFQKIVICSDSRSMGSAFYVKKYDAGIIVDLDAESIAEAIVKVVNLSNKNLQEYGARGRIAYEENFSPKVFSENLKQIIIPLRKKKLSSNVSVIIPTFNAGEQFYDLIYRLKHQNDIDSVEIIVVDSGSTDKTLSICKEFQVKVIPIPQEQFSHSYARNLGASKANGEILVFITQDALPSSEYWLRGFISPIVKEEAVAVSCGEIPPKHADLYYKICSFLHSQYLGSLDEIRSLNTTDMSDLASLHKNASLNDVACAIAASVFEDFQYRGDFAEDLDLGCRLIKKGFYLKHLHSIKVIHGHNRTIDYYFGRGVLETKFLLQILGSFNQPNDRSLLCTYVAAYFWVLNFFSITFKQNSKDHPMDFNELKKRVSSDNGLDFNISFSEIYGSKKLIEILREIFKVYSIAQFSEKGKAVITTYINNSISNYIYSSKEMSEYSYADYEKALLCFCAQKIANYLADDPVNENIRKMVLLSSGGI